MNHCAVTNVDLGCFDLVNEGRERTRKIYQGQWRCTRRGIYQLHKMNVAVEGKEVENVFFAHESG